jgi:SAM-dependent MidA family methyltransferase
MSEGRSGAARGMEPGLVRVPPADAPPTESDPVLLERIRAEIAATGPLTFARFMELALYEPGLGYYRVEADRPGRSGDFLTAPETHPMFGAALGRQLDEAWLRLDRPDPFVLREYGPGSGTLATTILAGLRADGSGLAEALRYEPIEINEHRRAEIDARVELGSATPAGQAAAESGRLTGAILANEFLDALPVHRVEARAGRLLERFVDWDGNSGRLVDRPAAPSSAALEERLERDGVSLAEGQVAEICLAVDPWLEEVAGALERGLVLVLDYGHPAPVLYDPGRVGGSLRAYSGQQAHGDPFRAVGRQDLTAHVDLTALEAGARSVGLDVLGDVPQASFLLGCGLEELLERIRSNPATTMEDWLAARSAIGRFLDPAALGGFRAVLLGRGIGLPLRGLERLRHSPY